MNLTCQCGATPIIKGAIFCWNNTCQVRVGHYDIQEGQLVWTSNPELRGSAAVAFAVLVGEERRQVLVAHAFPAPNGIEVSLTLSEGPSAQATVRIAELVRLANRSEPEEQVLATLGGG